jgi:hypothetical protein
MKVKPGRKGASAGEPGKQKAESRRQKAEGRKQKGVSQNAKLWTLGSWSSSDSLQFFLA